MIIVLFVRLRRDAKKSRKLIIVHWRVSFMSNNIYIATSSFIPTRFYKKSCLIIHADPFNFIKLYHCGLLDYDQIAILNYTRLLD